MCCKSFFAVLMDFYIRLMRDLVALSRYNYDEGSCVCFVGGKHYNCIDNSLEIAVKKVELVSWTILLVVEQEADRPKFSKK